jgi:hypothetical protein
LPARLSGSLIERFRKCRRQYLLHLGEPSRSDGLRTPKLLIGIAVHAALASYGAIAPRLRTPERAEELLHRCLRSTWREHVRPSDFGSRREEANAGRDALRLLSTFVRSFDPGFESAAREKWVGARLSPPPGTKRSPYIYGRIDRVDIARDGTLQLVDYKTSIRQEIDLLSDPQVQVMTIAAEAELRREVSCVRFLYLGDGEETRIDLEREDVEFMATELVEVIGDMRSEVEFLPSPHPTICRWCPFQLLCPESGQIDPDSLEVPDDLAF